MKTLQDYLFESIFLNRYVLDEGQTIEQWYNQQVKKGNKNIVQKDEHGNVVGTSYTLDDVKRILNDYDPTIVNNEIGNSAYPEWIIKNKEGLASLGVKPARWGNDNVQNGWFYLDLFDKNRKNLANYKKREDPSNKNVFYDADINRYTPSTLMSSLYPIEDELVGNGIDKRLGKMKRAPEWQKGERIGDMPESQYDYRIIYKDDKWAVINTISQRANSLVGTRARMNDVNKNVFKDEIERRAQERLEWDRRHPNPTGDELAHAPKGIYQSAEWCTVPEKGLFHNYNTRGLLVTIPVVDGKIDWQSPYKCQCHQTGKGKASWANVLDVCVSHPVQAFRIPWTVGLYNKFVEIGYVNPKDPAEIWDSYNKGKMMYDMSNGEVTSRLVGASNKGRCLVDEFNQQAHDEDEQDAPRYEQIEWDNHIALGKEKTGYMSTFKVLNPMNGDPLIDKEFSECNRFTGYTEGNAYVLRDISGVKEMYVAEGANVNKLFTISNVKTENGVTVFVENGENGVISHVSVNGGFRDMEGTVKILGPNIYVVRVNGSAIMKTLTDDRVIAEDVPNSEAIIAFEQTVFGTSKSKKVALRVLPIVPRGVNFKDLNLQDKLNCRCIPLNNKSTTIRDFVSLYQNLKTMSTRAFRNQNPTNKFLVDNVKFYVRNYDF